MLRRSFLKGAAALAAAPVLPVAAEVAPIESAAIADRAVTVARYRNCFITYERGYRLFDANGVERVVIGLIEDLGRVIMIEERG